MFEKNTKQVNDIIVKIFAVSTIIIEVLVVCSYLGVFEFGRNYTMVILIAGLVITISPIFLQHILSENSMKYYMLVVLSVFIGVLGTNNHIGIYITYALVPIFSCLYFEPALILRASVFSYIIMLISLYINSAGKYEVVNMGMSRIGIFIAYALGFTIEYVIVSAILYSLVKRAKRMMEERDSAEEENRMKSQFLSSVSHEIRTPMNAIIGMADVALRQDMDEELRKYLSVIKSSSTGLLEIINDILDLSKIEAGKLTMINEVYETQSLIDDMKEIIKARNVDKGLPLYFHINGDMPEYLVGDAVRIKQVMFNYASNAIKYTETGQIDIAVNCQKLDDSTVNCTYIVKDTGQGVRKEDMDKIFTLYNQLNESTNYGKEGTGIGLAISKYFVEQMGGSVDVKSVFGKGSEFSFTVKQKIADPQKVKQQMQSRKADGNVDYFETRGVRTLLADDNELNREVVKAIVEPFHFTIDEVENGREAVAAAKQTKYDMIFMDSHMPVMNGEEATKKIRNDHGGINQNTPIVAITADAVAGVRERLMEGGMDDYVTKPIDAGILCEKIRKYLSEDKIVK